MIINYVTFLWTNKWWWWLWWCEVWVAIDCWQHCELSGQARSTLVM